jgi:DNA-binding NarL/FixJ family response regulator
MINVIIVEDQAVVRQSLKMLINNHGIANVVAEATNGEEFLAILPDYEPDVVLIDINMPVLDGLETTKRAMTERSNLNILALSSHGDEASYFKMVEAGVKGFILKGSQMDDLHLAIQAIAKGDSWFSPELLKAVANYITKGEGEKLPLKKDEVALLLLIIEGLTDHEIAVQMKSSKDSIAKKRSKILEKTNCSNTASLIMYAMKNKIIEV